MGINTLVERGLQKVVKERIKRKENQVKDIKGENLQEKDFLTLKSFNPLPEGGDRPTF